MRKMLKDIPGVTCYLDDVLITEKTPDEHLRKLETALKKFAEGRVRIKREKYSFFQNQLEYLGNVITAEGIQTSTEKVTAIARAPAPSNKQQLRSLLGIVNYYGKFVPQLATIAYPFYRLLRQDVSWSWDVKCQQAFQKIKDVLSSTEVLAHYDSEAPLQLSCDASPYGVGAVLSHIRLDKTTWPIAFASRTLTPAENEYSQLE